MTRFGDLARKRIARQESGVWELEQKAGEEAGKIVEAFRNLDDSTTSGWSASYRQRRQQRLRELLDTVWADAGKEQKEEVIKVLTQKVSTWNRNEKWLDALPDDQMPSEDPFASGEPEELTYRIIKQDIVDDRRENFLYWELFGEVDEAMESDESLYVEFCGYCYWLAAKTLVYGLERVPSMITLMQNFYPRLSTDLLQRMKRYAKKHKLAECDDRHQFLSSFFGEFPQLFDVCGGLLQTYSDSVRTERTVLKKADRDKGLGELPDSPNTVVDLRKQDLWSLRHRIRNAYSSTGSMARVAKAFERREGDVKQLLIDLGVIEQKLAAA